MPTLNPYFDQPTFDPEATVALSKAIEDACAALDISPGMAHDREVIAARIADLARSGLTDSNALRDRVVREARTPL